MIEVLVLNIKDCTVVQCKDTGILAIAYGEVKEEELIAHVKDNISPLAEIPLEGVWL